jgi:hypothetical protein
MKLPSVFDLDTTGRTVEQRIDALFDRLFVVDYRVPYRAPDYSPFVIAAPPTSHSARVRPPAAPRQPGIRSASVVKPKRAA